MLEHHEDFPLLALTHYDVYGRFLCANSGKMLYRKLQSHFECKQVDSKVEFSKFNPNDIALLISTYRIEVDSELL